MTKSPKLSRKTWLLIALLAALLVLIYPLKHLYHTRAIAALRQGDAQTDINRALVWYKIAATLEPRNPAILVKLAAADIKTNHPADAYRAASRAVGPDESVQALILESQALMELNQTDRACNVAVTAVQRSKSNPDASQQLGLCYALAGKAAELADTIRLLGSSGAATTLTAVQHNQFSLAQTLYGLGLLNSAQRVLIKSPIENSEYYLLRAQTLLQLSDHSQSNLEQGRGLLEKSVALSPERVDVRRALQQIDNELGDKSSAADQGTRIKALEAGTV